MMYNNNNYYEPEDGEGYPDDWDWKVEQYTFDLLENEYNYREPHNWGEALGELGIEEDYKTPSHAPVEVIEKVSQYWYQIAFKNATEYYEEHPYND